MPILTLPYRPGGHEITNIETPRINKKINNLPQKSEIVFYFRDNHNKRYTILIEEYEHNVFAVKFYLTKHSSSPNKYNIIVNKKNSDAGNARRIINTCINACIHLHSIYPLHSFAFMGERKEKEENYVSTQRYRIYKTLISTYFDDSRFEHIFIQDYSLFMLLNKANLETNPNLRKEIEDMLYDSILPRLACTP